MENKKKSSWFQFGLNVIFGFVILFALNGAHHTGIGQTLLNLVYDHLVREDFKDAIFESQKQGKPPLSDRIRIVTFDKETYEKSATQGYWTPRELLGESIRRSLESGARVVVVDFNVKRPAPLFCPDKNENQKFLELLRKAAEIARSNDAVILFAQNDEFKNEKDLDYEQEFEKITDNYKDVIRWGSTFALADPSSYYQVRHFQFYEYSKDRKDVFLSFQILAAVYLWHGRAEGDRIIRETKARILNGETELKMNAMKPIYLYSQEDRKESLPARYIFRIAPSEITAKLFADKGGIDDPLIKYRHSLRLRPELLIEKAPGDIFKDKAVLIGSTYKEMGDEHLTPLGKMPGVFLIANSINLFLEGLQLHEVVYLNWVSGIITIFISSLFFIWLPRNIAFGFLFGLFLIVNLMLSLQLLSTYGIFLDFLLPVVGIGGDRIVAGVMAFVEKVFR